MKTDHGAGGRCRLGAGRTATLVDAGVSARIIVSIPSRVSVVMSGTPAPIPPIPSSRFAAARHQSFDKFTLI